MLPLRRHNDDADGRIHASTTAVKPAAISRLSDVRGNQQAMSRGDSDDSDDESDASPVAKRSASIVRSPEGSSSPNTSSSVSNSSTDEAVRKLAIAVEFLVSARLQVDAIYILVIMVLMRCLCTLYSL